jgi:nicotinate-nucleotide pyrophosphorylase (carboxylating)
MAPTPPTMPTTTTMDFAALLPPTQIETMVQEWLAADTPSCFDVGAMVVGNRMATAKLYMKSKGVFAGKPFFDTIFRILGCVVTWDEEFAVEGYAIDPWSAETPHGKKNVVELATVTGPAAQILHGERTALNTLSRCSGVATAARSARLQALSAKWKGYVAGTRKTTPGSFRVVEKYGLLVGGVATHRLDLSQMVMLKDNHIVAAGSITDAVRIARIAAGFSQKIEVECQSLDEAFEAAAAGADIVMLDNFIPTNLKSAAALFKKQHPHVLVEASGGITVENMTEYMCDHVDIISQGKLTQGYECVDYSLKIV